MKKNISISLFFAAFYIGCQSVSDAPTPQLALTKNDSLTKNAVSTGITTEKKDTATVEIAYDEKLWAGNWSDKNSYNAMLKTAKAFAYMQAASVSLANKKFSVIDPEDASAIIHLNQQDPIHGYFTDAHQSLTPYNDKKVYLKMTAKAGDTTLWITTIEEKSGKTVRLPYMRYRPAEDMLLGKFALFGTKDTLVFGKQESVTWKRYNSYQLAANSDGKELLLFYTRKQKGEEVGCVTAAYGAMFVVMPNASGFDLYEFSGVPAGDCLNDFAYADGYAEYTGTLAGLRKKYTLQRVD